MIIVIIFYFITVYVWLNQISHMKNLALLAATLLVTAACTKSETQYTDQSNKKQSVNDKKSDTIQTLTEISDTLQKKSERADGKRSTE